MQIAAGLSAAHGQGLVHRDVKPSNILLENGVERVKITDFGLARAVDDVCMTQSGTVAGTPHYMSPEQAGAGRIDHRSDLFSLGSILYAMCVGRPPFRSETMMGILKRVTEETPSPVRELNPEIPDWMVAIVMRMLEKNPDDRFPSASEVSQLLGEYLAHVQNPETHPLPDTRRSEKGSRRGASPEPISPSRHRRRLAVSAFLGIAAIGLLSLLEVTGIVDLVTPMFEAVPEDTDPERRAAEWVLEIGGTVVLKSEAGTAEISQVNELPAGDFTVLQIDLGGNQLLRDADLARLKGLAELSRIDISDTQVTDQGLLHLQGHVSLFAVHLHSTAVTDRGLEHLQGLPALQGLGLTRTAVTGSFLQHFQDHPRLQVLELDYSKINDQGLQGLQGLTEIYRLQVSHTGITDAGFMHLRHLQKLHSLHANDIPVTDAGLAALEDLEELENLELCVTQVTDAGLKHVGRLRSLTRLLLKDTPVGDEGLRELQNLSKLSCLCLIRTQVTDKGLAHLATLPCLTRIDLQSTRVTPTGVATLQAALPDCVISSERF